MLVEIDIHISIRIHGYDNQGQLLTESGTVSGFPEAPYSYSNAYQYDSVGNIKSFSDGTTTHTYAYEDADWKDLLTSYDGQSITYDSNGNPTSYFNGNRWTFGWENGRQLTTLSKQAPVIITTQPENFFGTAGSTATFTVKAEGDRVTYQWQRSKDEGKTWTDISGETSETLNVTIQSSDFGSQYRCIAKDFMGHVATSQAGKLASSIASQSAWDPEYTIINEPDDYYGRPGDIATFIVEAEGKNLSYQWLYQAPGTDELVYCTSSDATTNTIRVEMTAESDGAQYCCFITDANGDMGSTRTATVRLDVRDWTMEYEAGGLRTKRSSAEKTYNYIYSGDKLVRMTCGDNILDFTYDANGAPLTLVTGGKVYYYLTNLQGDVISVESSDGTPVASYCYDAWGKILACDGALAELNPLRYRGYVYDQETGFYYLQSRYYDPAVGRFINADDVAYLGADKSMPSYNLFAYCHNNPVVGVDPTGYFLISTAVLIGVAVGGVIGGSLGGVFAYNIAKSKGAKGWKLAGKTALGVVGGGVAGAALGAAAGYGIGYLAGGTYANGLVAKSVDSGVKAFVSQANKVHHVLGKTGHNLAGYTTKSMGNLMRRTLINGSVEPYKSVFSAYWARKNSEVTFNIVNGALKISDMWIR